MAQQATGIGLIGVGGTFGSFISDALRDVRGKLVAVADVKQAALDRARDELGVEATYTDYRQLIGDERVQLVIVATPPFTQHEIGMAVLRSGKALFIEKPGSVRLEDFRELVDYQREHRVPASIDYVMRWNQLLDVVRQIRARGWLGPMQSSTFLNYAQDETLPEGHWFWDRAKSGGIWVEHCVHFFDLYGALAGTPPVSVAATYGVRDDTAPGGRVDQVSGAVVHEGDVVCTYFHAFDRPKAMERQEAIVAFERGFASIKGWIAEEVQVEGWVSNRDAEGLLSLPHVASSQQDAIDREMRRGDLSWHADRHVAVRCTLPWDRTESYRREVAAGINDLLQACANPSHTQSVTLVDALRSLAVACAMAGTASMDEARAIYERYRPDGR